MKRFMYIFVLTLALGLLNFSCSDDDNATGPSDLKIGEMTATVGGANFKAQNALFYNITGQVSGAFVDNPLDPQNSTTQTISIVLQKNSQDVEIKSYQAICYYQETSGFGLAGSTESWNDVSGSCEVTEVTDDNIRGTFTFIGKNEDDNTTKEVTGSFYVPRQ